VPVPVHIRHRGAGRPACASSHARPLGDLLEPVIPLIEIEPVRTQVGREVEIRQAVVVDVADGDPATVVIVEIIEDVELGVFRQLVDERDAGRFGLQQLEERSGILAGTARHGWDAGDDDQGARRRDATHGGQLRVLLVEWPDADRLSTSGGEVQRQRERASTGRLEILTGNGLSRQWALGPSASLPGSLPSPRTDSLPGGVPYPRYVAVGGEPSRRALATFDP
jgi:hypothetical protein